MFFKFLLKIFKDSYFPSEKMKAEIKRHGSEGGLWAFLKEYRDKPTEMHKEYN